MKVLCKRDLYMNDLKNKYSSCMDIRELRNFTMGKEYELNVEGYTMNDFDECHYITSVSENYNPHDYFIFCSD